jgi:hypothetical protein
MRKLLDRYCRTLQLAVLFCFALCLGGETSTAADSHKVTVAEARQLVETGLKDKGYDVSSPQFELDEEANSFFPNFYHFGASIDSKTRFVRVGSYAVDPRTADVWDEMLCERLQSPSLAQSQARIRKKYKLERSAPSPNPPCSE